MGNPVGIVAANLTIWTGHGWHRELGSARRSLKEMLLKMIGAPAKRQREAAAILKRALADIDKLD